MRIAGHTQPEDIYRLATRVGSLESNLPAVGDRIFYVSPRGNDANSGLSWGKAKKTLDGAVTAMGGVAARIQLGYGQVTSAAVTLPSYTVVQGLGGMSAGAVPLSSVIFAATGAGSLINMQNTLGVRLQDFQLLYSNAGFAGRCVDARNVAGADTALFDIANMYIGGSAVNGAIEAIAVNKAISGTIRNCNIVGNQRGIVGRSAAGTYSNRIVVTGCSFSLNAVRHISNIGEAWSIYGNTFEPITSAGAAGAIANDAGIAVKGLNILGNWFGDITAAAGGSQISLGGTGIAILGNQIGFNDGAVGVTLAAASTGIKIGGNEFDSAGTSTGISLGAGCTDYDMGGNTFVGVTTPIAGVTSTEIHRALVDAVQTYRWNSGNGTLQMVLNTNNGFFGLFTTPASSFHVGGSFQTQHTPTAVDLPLTAVHSIVDVDATAAARTATLPSAVGVAGRVYEITKEDASVNAVTVATTGGQTINGAATVVLALQFNTVRVISNGANWRIH